MMARDPDQLGELLKLHASLKSRSTKVSPDCTEAVLLHLIIARLKFHVSSRGVSEFTGITVTKTA